MDTHASENIQRRLGELKAKSLKEFERELWRIFPAFDPIYDSMVSKAARAAEENASRLLSEIMLKVSAISQAPEAFGLVQEGIAGHLRDLEAKIEEGRGVPLTPATLKIASDRSVLMRQRVNQDLESYRVKFTGDKRGGGRPPKLDWEGALIHLIALANTPDGLLLEKGDQAKIERIINEWFVHQTGEEPALSAVRERASRVMTKLREYKKA